MIIKQPDDRGRRLRLLEELQVSPVLDDAQRHWAAQEVRRVRFAEAGEREVAEGLRMPWGMSSDFALLHDLRLLADGETAHFDHLLVHRSFTFIMLESTLFNGHLSVAEDGNLTLRYGSRRAATLPSFLLTAALQERVLRATLDSLGLTKYAGQTARSVMGVVVHPKARIEVASARARDARAIVRLDALGAWLDATLKARSSPARERPLAKPETLQQWGAALAQRHRPLDPLALPKFMLPQPAAPTPAGPGRMPAAAPPVGPATPPDPAAAAQAAAVAEVMAALNQEENPDHPEGGQEFGPTQVPSEFADTTPMDANLDELRFKCVCAACGRKISFPEARACWKEPQRYSGLQYCVHHQALFAAPAE